MNTDWYNFFCLNKINKYKQIIGWVKTERWNESTYEVSEGGSTNNFIRGRKVYFKNGDPFNRLRQKYMDLTEFHTKLALENSFVFFPSIAWDQCWKISLIEIKNLMTKYHIKCLLQGLTAHNRWQVFRGESTDSKDMIFSAKRSSMIQLKTKLHVFLANNTREDVCDFRVEGSWFERSCSIYLGQSSTVIAQVINVMSLTMVN